MKLLKLTYTVTIVTLIQLRVLQGQQRHPLSCGRRLVNHQALITNGCQSKEGDWPWHVAIYHVGTNQDIAYKCGGSVLTPNSILTAAHCVFENGRPITPERVLVQLGKYNLRISGPNTQEFQVMLVFLSFS